MSQKNEYLDSILPRNVCGVIAFCQNTKKILHLTHFYSLVSGSKNS